MKLYLSSYRVPSPHDLFALVGKAPETVKIALLPNAKDLKEPSEYQESLEEVAKYFGSFKCAFEVIDLRLFSVATALKERLEPFDLIWACGGNTFMLRYQMRRSGLEEILPDLLRQKVYGGESAGAIVAGISLKGIQRFDDPTHVPELIWEGLGLVDKMILPHADSPDFIEGMPELIEQYPDKRQRIVLNDNEAYIMDGARRLIVSAPRSA